MPMTDAKSPERKNPDDVLISREVVISAPRETVFNVLEDIKLFVELEENVKKVTITSDVKQGKGMKSHWIMEDPGTGEHWEVEEEVVEYKKPELFSYIGNAGGKDYAGIHNLRENRDGTTHLCFNELFYFKADPEALGRVIEGMLQNVKKESERRNSA